MLYLLGSCCACDFVCSNASWCDCQYSVVSGTLVHAQMPLLSVHANVSSKASRLNVFTKSFYVHTVCMQAVKALA